MQSTIFAQLCQELTTVEDISNVTVFEFYGQPLGGHGELIYAGRLVSMEFFLDLFYNNGIFRINDCCNNYMQLDYHTNNPPEVPDGWWYTDGVSNIPLTNISKMVLDQWALDASNNGTFHWDTCSYLTIQSQLLKARNICHLACDVCCSLTQQQLADILNEQDHINGISGSYRTAFAPVKTGDHLILSLFFTNDNPLVNPIEFRLYFKIQ